MFLNDPNKVLFVLELDFLKESQHLRFIISIINSIDKNFQMIEKKLVKNICIVVRQKRSDKQKKPLFLFKGWRFKMFEDLNYDSKALIEDLLQKNLTNILKDGQIFNIDQFIVEIVEKSLNTLSLKTSLFNYQYLNVFKKEISEVITSDQGLIDLFKEKITQAFELFDKSSKEKWDSQLFTNERIIYSAVSIKDALKLLIFDKFLLEFTKLLVACEKKSGLSSLLFANRTEDLMNIWKKIFVTIKTTKIQVKLMPESNNLNFISFFYTPYFYEDYKLLKTKNKELVNNEMPKSQIPLALKDFHLEKSILKEKSYLFYSDKLLAGYFISDFIEVSLIEKMCETRYSNLVYYFVYGILSSADNDTKVSVLFVSQTKIVAYNNL